MGCELWVMGCGLWVSKFTVFIVKRLDFLVEICYYFAPSSVVRSGLYLRSELLQNLRKIELKHVSSDNKIPDYYRLGAVRNRTYQGIT